MEYKGELYNDNPDLGWVHDPGCDRGHVGRDLGSDHANDPSPVLVELSYGQLATKYGVSESTVKRCIRELRRQHGGTFGTQVTGRPTQFSLTEVNLVELTLLTKSDPTKDIEQIDRDESAAVTIDIEFEELNCFNDLVSTTAIVPFRRDMSKDIEELNQVKEKSAEALQDLLADIEEEAEESANNLRLELARIDEAIRHNAIVKRRNALSRGKPILKKKESQDS